MELDVFRRAGSVLMRIGTCRLASFSSRQFEVLHDPEPDSGPRRPVEAHAFEVIDLNDEHGARAGLLARGHANPSVLPGWRAA